MKEKHREKWRKIRARGKGEFILKYGGVIFGLLGIGLLVPAAKIILGFLSSEFTFSFFDRNFLFRIITGLIIAFPAGCLWGWILWEINEWSYSKR
jgi:hypothetical protein